MLPASGAEAPVFVSPRLCRDAMFLLGWDESLRASVLLHIPNTRGLVIDYLARLHVECFGMGMPVLTGDAQHRVETAAPLVQICVVFGPPLVFEHSQDPSVVLVAAVDRVRERLELFGACFECGLALMRSLFVSVCSWCCH